MEGGIAAGVLYAYLIECSARECAKRLSRKAWVVVWCGCGGLYCKAENGNGSVTRRLDWLAQMLEFMV